MAGFESLGESLDKSWRRSPIRGAVLAVKVEEALKEQLPNTPMVSFKQGKLILSAASPAQANDLYLKSRELKKKINAALNSKVVEEIRYRIKG